MESALTKTIIELALQYGWYGYRRITALLNSEGIKDKNYEKVLYGPENNLIYLFLNRDMRRLIGYQIIATKPKNMANMIPSIPAITPPPIPGPIYAWTVEVKYKKIEILKSFLIIFFIRFNF